MLSRMHRYTLLLTLDEESGYPVAVPTVPGGVTQGETVAECVASARDAIALYIEESRASRRPPLQPAVCSNGQSGDNRWAHDQRRGGRAMTTMPSPDAGPQIESNLGWDALTYLPQRRRSVAPTVTAELQGRLPVIHDFRVMLRPHDDGYLAPEFWSARRGFLVHCFPFRDYLGEEFHSADEALFGIGDAANPLVDIEQGQELFVWRQDSEVLVIAGDPEAEPGSFRVAVRVPEEVFASEWWRFCAIVRRYATAGKNTPLWLRDDEAADD